MAYDKKMIQRLISRPEMMGLDELDENGEALAPDESEDPSLLEDAQDAELTPDDMLQDESADEEQDPELLAEAPAQSETPEIDSELTAMLKKLKSGQPLEDDSDQGAQETAGDPNASVEMRKAAIQKIKQKYLGQ